MKSILSNEHQCYICGNTYDLDKHHIYGGGNRQVSEANGFWVYLCKRHHTMSCYAVHPLPGVEWYGEENKKMLQTACQKVYERTHTREEFIRLIGKNYIDE